MIVDGNGITNESRKRGEKGIKFTEKSRGRMLDEINERVGTPIYDLEFWGEIWGNLETDFIMQPKQSMVREGSLSM